ncbi:3-hydroxyacyl-CoA dehydrogenase [Ligilactobacillus salivarius]|uniref:3-hydroxyacyl-CoA dehydrogenase n=1 Tax=Ligilactobacillus salivarius TaxID=1624 RepID=UPI003C2F0F42
MSFKKITIAGAGTLGSQIAFQAAFYGFTVSIWNPHPDRAIRRLNKVQKMYKQEMGITDSDVKRAMKNIVEITNDMEIATKNTEYVIESVPENLEIKGIFYQKMCQVLPKDVILASNSSTLVPSQLVKFVDRPEKFLHMHFANHIWKFNTSEIVGNEKTDKEVIDKVVEFAKEINMLPIVLKKEQSGYIMNSLSVPYLNAALGLWAKGVADPMTIDKDWMKATGSPMGPFMSLDAIGLRTTYAIFNAHAEDAAAKAIADKLKRMIDEGHYGIEAGEGFYKYPHPAYESADFLKV